MEVFLAILLVMAIYVGTPVIIGFVIVGGIQVALKSRMYLCTVDADCPPGYVCLGGRCVPQQP